MEIKIIQTITNTLSEDRELLKSTSTEVLVLAPSEGKALKNITTGEIFYRPINIGTKLNLKNYIEISI